MSLNVWFRVIRVRFLLSSVIAVFGAFAISWLDTANINFFHAVLTACGVVALHASIDLLNDYWDFKRGIDTITKRTKLSGGTGVLPEGLLQPEQVFRAGFVFLILGSSIGVYFILIYGVVIASILAFAILSIYFYSTKIVNFGLGEVFVTLKGTLIVIGAYFIQTTEISSTVVLGGIVVGLLSSLVLFITSFPDYNADKQKGRKTLVIALGKNRATSFYWLFPVLVYGTIFAGIAFDIFSNWLLITLLGLPLVLYAGKNLRTSQNKENFLVPAMEKTLIFSRITGILLVVGFFISSLAL